MEAAYFMPYSIKISQIPSSLPMLRVAESSVKDTRSLLKNCLDLGSNREWKCMMSNCQIIFISKILYFQLNNQRKNCGLTSIKESLHLTGRFYRCQELCPLRRKIFSQSCVKEPSSGCDPFHSDQR